VSPRLGGALLVALGVAAAFGHYLQPLFAAAALVWLLCLRRSASARLVLLVAVLVRVPFLFSDYHSNDLYRYVWEGRIQLEGYNPYASAPADPALVPLRGDHHDRINHPEYPSLYPPLAQAFFAGAAGLGLEERGLRNLILGLDVAVVAVVLGWLRATGRPPGWAILYAWCPLAVASVAVGHVEPLMLVCVAGGAWAWEARRPYAAAALLGAAVLAKTVAVLCVPWLILRRPRAALATLIPVLLLGYLPYLTPGLFDTLHAFGADFAFNSSLFRVAAGLAPWAAHAIVAGLLVFWLALVTLTQPRIAHACVLCFAGLLLLSPTVHFWYLTWFLVALPAVGPRRWTLPLVVWTVSVLFASETYRAHYLDGAPFVERFGLTALEYALPLLAAAWLVWRGWPRRAPLAPALAPAAASPGSFAVIVPCRGEADNLRTLLPRWLATDAARVIVADTPTGDGTEALTRSRPRLVYLPVEQRGYGAAVRAGLAAAGGVDFAVVCDADHGRGPDQVAVLLTPFADPEVGLVTAARMNARHLSRPQRLGNALSTFLIALGWGRRFHDLGPFRALRRARWPQGALHDAGYGWNVEMNVRALELGLKVVEVPLPASVRARGEDRISGTLRGVLGAGFGILSRLYRLREQSCRQPSSS
jgi:hypothetical protein